MICFSLFQWNFHTKFNSSVIPVSVYFFPIGAVYFSCSSIFWRKHIFSWLTWNEIIYWSFLFCRCILSSFFNSFYRCLCNAPLNLSWTISSYWKFICLSLFKQSKKINFSTAITEPNYLIRFFHAQIHLILLRLEPINCRPVRGKRIINISLFFERRCICFSRLYRYCFLFACHIFLDTPISSFHCNVISFSRLHLYSGNVGFTFDFFPIFIINSWSFFYDIFPCRFRHEHIINLF